MTKQNEKLTFHELEELPEAVLVEACEIANRFPRHVHSSYIFSLIDQGERKVCINSQTYSYCAGEMCILPPALRIVANPFTKMHLVPTRIAPYVSIPPICAILQRR